MSSDEQARRLAGPAGNGRRSPAARVEADDEGRRRAAAGSPDWVDRYGFGAEDEIYGRGL